MLVSYISAIQYKYIHYVDCVDSTLSFALRMKYIVFLAKCNCFFLGERDYNDHKLHIQIYTKHVINKKQNRTTVIIQHQQKRSLKEIITQVSIFHQYNTSSFQSLLSPRPSALGQSPRSEVYLLAAPA